ncbi:hypothetical protein JCM10213_003460 [Rhodosporidiobolus nylandii]
MLPHGLHRRALHHFLPRRPLKAHELAPLPPSAKVWSTELVTERKSSFVGHAVRVRSVDEATLALQHILADKRLSPLPSPPISRRHNILAYRLTHLESPTLLSGSDCHGEPPAGKNLLALLEKLDVKDVLLVVTRWYGGVPMGGLRFQVINQVGKQALDLGGFTPSGAEQAGRAGKKR